MNCGDKKYVFGIDLGGTNIKGAILGLEGNIIVKEEIPTLAEKGPAAVADRMVQLTVNLMDAAGIARDELMGAGLGVPGQIDCVEGCVLKSGNLDWQEVHLVGMIAQKLQLPVFIENDATAAALGEKWRGAGRDAQNCVMLTIGTGIGGGIIIDGRVYRGVMGYGGEIGHMVIQANGPLCSCGNKGCLEALTAAPAILRRARAAVDRGEKTLMADIDPLQVKDIFEVAAQDDPVALQVIDETAFYLGIGLGNLINIFNPEVLIIGGGVSRGGEILLAPLRKYAFANCLQAPRSNVRILPAQLGNDAGFMGAGAVALQALGYGT